MVLCWFFFFGLFNFSFILIFFEISEIDVLEFLSFILNIFKNIWIKVII